MQYLLIIGGIIALFVGSGMNKKLNKYEFEHRTDGGTITFPDYEYSVKHKRNRGIAKILMNAALISIVIGIIMSFA